MPPPSAVAPASTTHGAIFGSPIHAAVGGQRQVHKRPS
uniref:Uncharacterized protein n=1 Tax=Triticum urartu TaxID=4572 RepID=A0A8R7Q4H4_TRIUA